MAPREVMARYMLRAKPEVMARWKERAEKGPHKDFAEHVRAALDAYEPDGVTLSPALVATVREGSRLLDRPVAVAPKPKGKRTQMCEHRIAPDAYCGRCD